MNIDVLFMGSSHMEALYVKQNENAAAVLEETSGLKVYNIGVLAHSFANLADNIRAAAEKYSPSKYVIIETPSITFTDDELNKILSGSVPKQGSRETKSFLRLFLRRSPYLRYLVRQAKLVFPFPNASGEQNNPVNKNNPALLSQVLEKMKRSSPAKIIIAYHPPIILNDDGTMKIDSDNDEIKIFSELCAQNGIYFIETSKRFLDEYAKNFALPYGFMNTSVGQAHLNKNGHKFFAEEIYKLIQEVEAQS